MSWHHRLFVLSHSREDRKIEQMTHKTDAKVLKNHDPTKYFPAFYARIHENYARMHEKHKKMSAGSARAFWT